MHIIGAVGGYRYQSGLWRFIEDGKLEFHDLTTSEVDMKKSLANTKNCTLLCT